MPAAGRLQRDTINLTSHQERLMPLGSLARPKGLKSLVENTAPATPAAGLL